MFNTDNVVNGCTDALWHVSMMLQLMLMMVHVIIVNGCTDPSMLNYDPSAVCDDGSCVMLYDGCMDLNACNFDSLANFDDGSLYILMVAQILMHVIMIHLLHVMMVHVHIIYGCTDPA